MRYTTIDNLDIKEHVRWIQDQAQVDVTLIKEARQVASQSEVMGVSCIYPSFCEELFEWHKRNQPWALFSPPPRQRPLGKHYFSYRLFERKGHEGEEGDDLEPISHKVAQVQPTGAVWERDRAILLQALHLIRSLERLLGQLIGRKCQYQKG
jgi:hypothetical protein